MKISLSSWLVRGLLTGAIGAVATGAVIARHGKRKTGSWWTPFNATTHMIFGEAAANVDGFRPAQTTLGLGIHAVSLLIWGVGYERLAGKVPLGVSVVPATVATGVIYALDYHVLPDRLRPGFEKRVGNDAVREAYAALMMVFALSPLWGRRVKR